MARSGGVARAVSDAAAWVENAGAAEAGGGRVGATTAAAAEVAAEAEVEAEEGGAGVVPWRWRTRRSTAGEATRVRTDCPCSNGTCARSLRSLKR